MKQLITLETSLNFLKLYTLM